MHLAGLSLRLVASRIALPRRSLFFLVFLVFASPVLALDVDEARQQFVKGRYEECFRNCQRAIAEQEYSEEWRLLGIQSLLELGRYTNALELVTTALDRYSSSVQIR